jgi:hypothetical protein
LVVVRLWSAVYGTVRSIIGNSFTNIEMPCLEVLWAASAASEWKRRSLQVDSRSARVQDAVESLFANTVTPYYGLANLCLVVCLLVYADELRMSSSMSPTELNDHLGQAIGNWISSDVQQKDKYAASISVPAAAYARLSLHVDIQAAMRAFLKKEFMNMRDILRKGDLVQASRYGMQGIVPWSIAHRNQISMVSVPCGKTSSLVGAGRLLTPYTAVVACEAILMCRVSASMGPDFSGPIGFLRKAFNISTHADLTEPAALWACLRRIIESGPRTF